MKKLLVISALLGVGLIWSCSTKTVEGETEEVNLSSWTLEEELQQEADSAYKGNLYYRVFTEVFESGNCASGGCHDGSFEPDFRTLYSAYNSLVLHPVVKSDEQGTFKYRVEPHNTDSSWLVERITTDDAVLGRMPLYSEPLSTEQINLVKEWINGGCVDEWGNVPSLPNPEPVFFGVIAFVGDKDTGEELSYTRGEEFYYPLQFPNNETIEIWVGLYDLTEDGDFILGGELTHNKYQISDDVYDFAGVPTQDMTVLPLATPFMYPIPNSEDMAPYYHSFKLNTADFTPGVNYGFRVNVRGKDNTNITIFPDDDSPFYFKTLFSFVVND